MVKPEHGLQKQNNSLENMELKAEKVSVGEEFGVLSAIFSSDTEQFCYVTIQYQYELDEQDLEHGWSNYYLEVNDQSVGSYSCINSVQLVKNIIRISLNDKGKLIFNSDMILIDLEKVSSSLIEIENFLVQAFKDDTTVDLQIN